MSRTTSQGRIVENFQTRVFNRNTNAVTSEQVWTYGCRVCGNPRSNITFPFRLQKKKKKRYIISELYFKWLQVLRNKKYRSIRGWGNNTSLCSEIIHFGEWFKGILSLTISFRFGYICTYTFTSVIMDTTLSWSRVQRNYNVDIISVIVTG